MLLHLSLAAAPGLPQAAAAWAADHAELVVDADRCRAADLAGWLRQHLAAAGGPARTGRAGAVPLLVGGMPLENLSPGTVPLVDGAVIVCGSAGPALRGGPRRPERPLLALAVAGGPDAGRIFELHRGVQVLGRNSRGLGVQDPLLSRRHALVEVSGQGVRLRDAGSANGLVADGSIPGQVELCAGMTVAAGSSRLRLLAGNEPLGPLTPETDLAEPVPVRARPPDARGRAALLLAGLPLLAGLVLAAATGMWFFLGFGALSLATAAVPYAAGRKLRRAYRAAVGEAAAADAQRRHCTAPDAARVVYGLLEPAELPAAGPLPEPGHLWLRLGAADQPANIGPPGASGGLEPPLVAQAPVVVDLLQLSEFVVRGSSRDLDGMLRSCLLQLGRRALDSTLRIICCAEPGQVPASARFIPGVELAGCGTLPAAVQDRGGTTVLLVAGNAAALPVPSGPAGGPPVVRFIGPACPGPAARPVPPGGAAGSGRRQATAVLTLDSGRAMLDQDRQRLGFTADLVAPDTLDRFARLAAKARPGRDTRQLPERYPLEQSLAGESMAERWQRHRGSAGLAAAIGCTEDGPLLLDLAADGPHLLIAGTTGSGKSELLRSLVLGLAATYPPPRVSFLLVDFKGGATLAPLSGLPHTVGLLTDLSVENVGRTLSWLRAEVRRRETLLSGLGASDIAGCAGAGPARLLVVVDEYRMLVDEVPEAVHELMRIAALGRSLGVHLVLATQRPQGAVSADIRANVNAAIALRVLSGPESADVLGTPAAASIPARTPGRAYLRLAGDPPVLFQSASAQRQVPRQAAVRTLAEWFAGQDGREQRTMDDGPRAPGPDLAAELAAESRRTAAALQLSVPGAVLAPPLPAELDPAAEGLVWDGPDGTGLGLLDLPDEQRQVRLRWLPERDGHLALAGAAASGAGEALQWQGAALLAGRTERHCYLLDGDGSLARLAGAARVGAYAGPSETARGARMLRRLARETADRLASAAACSAGPDAPGGGTRVPLVLMLSGWDRWMAAFRNGRLGWAEECLQDIVRDGAACRVSLAVSGDRDLVSARFFGLVPNRCFLPYGSTPETRLAWPRLPPLDPLPGRALVHGRICGGREAAAQLAGRPRQAPQPRPAAERPFRVEALPGLVRADSLPDPVRAASLPGERAAGQAPVIGVEGDELQASVLPLRAGEAYLVLGGPGSGKSNLLDLLARAVGREGMVRRPQTGRLSDGYWELLQGAGAGTVLLVDDADRLGPVAQHRLAELVSDGAAAVLTAAPGPYLLQRVPLAAQARSAGWGLVLAPRSPADGDFFGLRLDTGPATEPMPPGRGYRVEHGRGTIIQIALNG